MLICGPTPHTQHTGGRLGVTSGDVGTHQNFRERWGTGFVVAAGVGRRIKDRGPRVPPCPPTFGTARIFLRSLDTHFAVCTSEELPAIVITSSSRA